MKLFQLLNFFQNVAKIEIVFFYYASMNVYSILIIILSKDFRKFLICCLTFSDSSRINPEEEKNVHHYHNGE